ncbi:DUF4826 family protein [Aliikangiella sp. G2MR2-5]|uniref:DUF4826 family protein n=1 Tax=Aliikangiella sp. G2MR2-5 TaxID=2788943 RepID=UPI0018A9210F|nr:DUF4826 family protein [Aliikangiella sp. G2MR2-5]
MTEQVQQEPMSAQEKEEQIKRWNQEEFVKVQKFCVSKGVQPKKIEQSRTQCLPPVLGVWYVNSTTKGEDYWVLSGQLPTDLAPAKVANHAREALRYFSMNWQLKAANIEDAIAEGKFTGENKNTQEAFAKELVSKAEALYQIYSDEKLWAQTGLKAS